MQNFDHNIDFWEKRQFFRRKLAKIAENCDHNIDPWSTDLLSWSTTRSRWKEFRSFWSLLVGGLELVDEAVIRWIRSKSFFLRIV
jgi:hypothetical protein